MTSNERGQPVDLIGRQVPHRLNVLSFVAGISGFADQLHRVPAAHVKVARGETTVACPCGAVAVLERLRFTRCVGGCGRIFTFAGETAYVAYGTPDAGVSGS